MFGRMQAVERQCHKPTLGGDQHAQMALGIVSVARIGRIWDR